MPRPEYYAAATSERQKTDKGILRNEPSLKLMSSQNSVKNNRF